ncbi:hypothetical protein CEXT_209451 [Caerostris extrusa]|uniref:Uncharacterized protein n=1 Tax=Caerostris extrusa TaxID=172846 RepID=A0AAV4ML62_CAEEX|nr:hypothetical protein CEXT_209451 [Caerostris extrusa]
MTIESLYISKTLLNQLSSYKINTKTSWITLGPLTCTSSTNGASVTDCRPPFESAVNQEEEYRNVTALKSKKCSTVDERVLPNWLKSQRPWQTIFRVTGARPPLKNAPTAPGRPIDHFRIPRAQGNVYFPLDSPNQQGQSQKLRKVEFLRNVTFYGMERLFVNATRYDIWNKFADFYLRRFGLFKVIEVHGCLALGNKKHFGKYK